MIFNKTNFRIHSLIEKDSRYSGIHVTPDFTEVTNGHYLIRVDAPFKGRRKKALEDLPIRDEHVPVTRKCEFIVPAGTAKEIERNIPNEKYVSQLNYAWIVNDEEGKATFLTTDLQTDKPVTFRKIDEKFPLTDKILEGVKEKAPIVIEFNADYMMKICQQYKKADIRGVSLSLYGLQKAMKMEGINVETQQTITTVLMPMQLGNGEWNVKEKKQEKD